MWTQWSYYKPLEQKIVGSSPTRWEVEGIKYSPGGAA
jgi:hypothetical protein